MARKLRVQDPGAVYHVMNRGDRREPIYADDQDRLLFLDTLVEACEKTDWQAHAWCPEGDYEPRGWCLGSEEFRQELLAQVSQMATPKDGGEEVRQSALAKAQRITQEELEALGWAARVL
jgi:hypothetical protein